MSDTIERPSLSTVIWFTALAYGITGAGALLNWFLVHRLDDPWMPYVVLLLKAGPSLAGLIMTVVLCGLPGVWRIAVRLSPSSVGGGWLVLAFAVVAGRIDIAPDLVFVAGLVGLTAILWLRRLEGMRRHLSDLGRRMLGRGWQALAVSLLLPLGLVVVSRGASAAFGRELPPASWPGLPDYLYGVVVTGGLIGPGLFEEIGWRGFALPQLQRRYSALQSSLIIGVLWGLWHFPNFALPADHPPWWQIAALVAVSMATSVVLTWVYNSTRGSLFAVVALHGGLYTAPALYPADNGGGSALIAGGLMTAVAVGLVLRCGAANLTRRSQDRHGGDRRDRGNTGAAPMPEPRP